LEDVDKGTDAVQQAAHGSLADLSQHGLEAREGVFDGVEVWALERFSSVLNRHGIPMWREI
jgi:hypothetical protein